MLHEKTLQNNVEFNCLFNTFRIRRAKFLNMCRGSTLDARDADRFQARKVRGGTLPRLEALVEIAQVALELLDVACSQAFGQEDL